MEPENVGYFRIRFGNSLSSCTCNAIYHVILYLVSKKPLFNTEISPQNDRFRFNLITGTIIYGVGLGLGGLDPITVLLQLPL
jgi:hypothetical protein